MAAVLVARMDNDGDVLLAGPAIRAVAASTGPVTLLCGSRGRAAAELLPGVAEIIEWTAPWIDPEPAPVDLVSTLSLVSLLRGRFAEALVLTSFHQSALPLALLLRLAGIARVSAVSEDYAGSLLDVRHRPDDSQHEVERSLDLVARSGYRLPPEDDGRLRIRCTEGAAAAPLRPYLVIHPGASVPARTLDADHWSAVAVALAAAGHRLVVTGSSSERGLADQVAAAAGLPAVSLAGTTSLGQLAEVLAGASAVIVGNTGPAHLAAAVGTPVVSVFAPTVPAYRWRPWGVPSVLLGDQEIECAGCRARLCPRPGHPCVSAITGGEVAAAVDQVLTSAHELQAAGR